MPILYVNPSGRRRKRFARIGKLKRNASKTPVRSSRRKKRRQPAAHWAKKRSKKSRKKSRARKKTSGKRKRARRSKMSKRRKKGSRRRGRKRSKKSYARAARLGHRRRKRRPSSSKKRRSRRKKRSKSRRRGRKRSRKSRARAARLGHRRRKRKWQGPIFRASKAGRPGTIVGYAQNPARKRRRKKSRRRGRRRGRRTAARYGWRKRRAKARKRGRRYKYAGKLRGKRVYYRSNPGKMLIDLAKKAVPIVLSTVAAKAIATKVGPRIPMLDRLGTFQGPVISILAVLGANYATKKVAFLAKRRDAILMGFAIAAIHETISALAPASVKGMLGMGDTYTQALAEYVATNDYEQVADGMSDYVAVGDMEQELGLDQELGYTAEMGDAYGQGGLGGAKAMLAPVPSRKFLGPVPSHSFTAPVPSVDEDYDNPAMLYAGIFKGGG